jgi:cysteine desulfurase
VIAYLDHAATTPMVPAATAAMQPFLTEVFGNPSGQHGAARAAKTTLEAAREQVATSLGADPSEVLFTGSGTEADNLAVKGAARAARTAGAGDAVVVTAFEHKAVLASAARLERDGFRVTRTRVDAAGIVDLQSLADALDETTALVSVMLVNNEVGTIQPLDEVAAMVRERAPRALLHTDAVQAVPWVDIRRAAAPADLVSISAHKFGGPTGVGALVRRAGAALEPLVEGGGQELGLRSGTSDVAGAVGLATALQVIDGRRESEVARVGVLRDRLARDLTARYPECRFHGDPVRRIAGNCNVVFPGIEAETLLVLLDQLGVCAAAGSSCTSGATEPSHVLDAMGVGRADALSSIRLSLGYTSTDRDVDDAMAAIDQAIDRLRPVRTPA